MVLIFHYRVIPHCQRQILTVNAKDIRENLTQKFCEHNIFINDRKKNVVLDIPQIQLFVAQTFIELHENKFKLYTYVSRHTT